MNHGVCWFSDAVITRLGHLPGWTFSQFSASDEFADRGSTFETAGLRLGVRFVVHCAIRMSKGVWRLSMEMFDVHISSACVTDVDSLWTACSRH